MLDLELIKARINELISDLHSPIVNNLFSHLQSGKMLRSRLVSAILASSHSIDSIECEIIKDRAISLCAALEMIQSASLLHDDVIDSAQSRRGQPSINAAFGDKNAIMLGDVLYSKAFENLAKNALGADLESFFENTTDSIKNITKEQKTKIIESFKQKGAKIAQIIGSCVAELSVGELEDVELGKNFNTNEKAYLEMLSKKTASLIAAAAQCAAVLANLNTNAFEKYGRNLGLAFQIVDDILDITQSEEKLGKPAFSDFCEGKTTLAFMYLYRELDNSEKERLKSLWGGQISQEDKNWIKAKMQSRGSILASVELAQNYGNAALSAIEQENCKKENLQKIIKDMIEREF